MWFVAFIYVVKIRPGIRTSHCDRLKASKPAGGQQLTLLQPDDRSFRVLGIIKRVFNGIFGMGCELSVPSVVFALCVKENHVMYVSVLPRVIVCTRSTPDYFVQEFIG